MEYIKTFNLLSPQETASPKEDLIRQRWCNMGRMSIKLNGRKWNKIFEKLETIKRSTQNNSDMVKMCVFFCYYVHFKRMDFLKNKTIMEFILEDCDKSPEKCFLEFFNDYIKFRRKGTLDY